MKKNLNEEKLSEKLMQISEYRYYMPELNEEPEDEPAEEEGLEDGDDLEDEDMLNDVGEELDSQGEQGDDLEDDIAGALDNMGQDGGEAMETGEEEVEIDVSGIVDSVNQNAESIEGVNQKLDSVSNQVNAYINKLIKNNQELATQINKMGQNLEKELRKRAPTPYEDIHMRSLSSYPYNQKLTDYWSPKKGDEYEYSIDNPNSQDTADYNIQVKSKGDEEEKPEEYVLTKKDLESNYSDIDIRNSL